MFYFIVTLDLYIRSKVSVSFILTLDVQSERENYPHIAVEKVV